MEKLIGTPIQKGQKCEIRTQIRSLNGYDLIDVRQFFDNPNEGEDERIPTKRGICLNIKQLPVLVRQLQEALEFAKANGMMDDGPIAQAAREAAELKENPATQ